jgi:membrane-bound lytic murein transglycosylase D
MPEETRNYVPRLLAIKRIVMDPSAYGLELPQIPNSPVFKVVPVRHDIDLALAAQLAGIPLEQFLVLNPAFNSKHAPAATGAGLVVPLENAESFKINLERHGESLGPKSGGRPGRSPASVTRF